MLILDVECFPPGNSVPILSSSNNQTTIEGEMITFICTFQGNYSPSDYDVYWVIAFQNGSFLQIRNDSNFSDYHISTKQNCPDTNYSCCRFTTELFIHTVLPLNNTAVTCTAMFDFIPSSSISYLSEFSIHSYKASINIKQLLYGTNFNWKHCDKYTDHHQTDAARRK